MQAGNGRRIRGLASDLTPPILKRTIRRMRPVSAADNHGAPKLPPSERDEFGPEFYDSVFESEERWTQPYWKMQWYASWAVLADRVMATPDARVLDMGCGAGHLGHLLHERGVSSYVGFDFSEKRLLAARELVPQVRFEIADAYTTDLFETVDYNVVTCCEFLEHLEGDLRVLDRIPAGVRVLGTVPSYDAPAHLRIFADEAEVGARYGSRFEQFSVSRIRNTGKGSEFLIDGVKT